MPHAEDNSRHPESVWRAAARAHQELWIAVPPGIVFWAVDALRDPQVSLLWPGLALLSWVLYGDWPDDNVWKRRGRKLKDAVTVRAGRLVVATVQVSR